MSDPFSPHFERRLLRASLVPTTSYVYSEAFEIPRGCNQIIAALDFTKGSLTSGQAIIEFCNTKEDVEAGNWMTDTGMAYNAGVTTLVLNSYTFTATGIYRVPVPIKDRFVRIGVKGTGKLTNSLFETYLTYGKV